jgi:hypothetical protein
MLVDPYNRFCIDCLHQRSSHSVLAYGIFVCENCAQKHKLQGARTKEVISENWDDD